MSGGHFDYNQRIINEIADEIENIIKTHNIEDEDGYCYNFSEKTIEEFKTAFELLKKSAIYVQRVDWLISGDDGEDTFHERLKEELNN